MTISRLNKLLLIILLSFSTSGECQFSIGLKVGGLAFHQKKVNPNYYRWSIDKKGHWVGYFGFSIVMAYQFNPFLGVKLIQTVLPSDCAGKFSGITHLGLDFHDRIVGAKNETHKFSGSVGPLFYYRKNWKEISNYYVDKNFVKSNKNNVWERKFVWYGGQIQYDFFFRSNQSFSTNFLPGYPYIYTFMSGFNQQFN